MMRRTLVLCALLTMTACFEERGTPEAYTERIDRNSVSSGDTTRGPLAVAPAAPSPPQTMPGSMRSTTVSLAPRDESQLRGNARMQGNGGSTIIDVTLLARNGGSYAGAIHRGTCASVGPYVMSLNTVSADSAGNGRSLTVVRLPIDTLLADTHVLVFGSGGRADTCGDVGAVRPPAAADSAR